MLIYSHYRLHLHFDIVWLVMYKSCGILKKCILEIGQAGFVDTLWEQLVGSEYVSVYSWRRRHQHGEVRSARKQLRRHQQLCQMMISRDSWRSWKLCSASSLQLTEFAVAAEQLGAGSKTLDWFTCNYAYHNFWGRCPSGRWHYLLRLFVRMCMPGAL